MNTRRSSSNSSSSSKWRRIRRGGGGGEGGGRGGGGGTSFEFLTPVTPFNQVKKEKKERKKKVSLSLLKDSFPLCGCVCLCVRADTPLLFVTRRRSIIAVTSSMPFHHSAFRHFDFPSLYSSHLVSWGPFHLHHYPFYVSPFILIFLLISLMNSIRSAFRPGTEILPLISFRSGFTRAFCFHFFIHFD